MIVEYYNIQNIMKLCRYLFSSQLKNKLIDEKFLGLRLDQYLKKNNISYSTIHKSLRNKQFYIIDQNHKLIKEPNYRLKNNDRIFFSKDYTQFFCRQQEIQQDADDFFKIPKNEAEVLIKKMLIFQNNQMLILNKNVDFSTQGGKDLTKNLFTILISYYNKQDIHIVHRLDKVSSGVLFFAKNVGAAKMIQNIINNKINIHKFYLAKSLGYLNKKEGLINCNIQWNPNKQKARLSNASLDDSQHAYTYFKVIAEQNNMTTLLIKLLTGRKHQIRCHLSQYLQNPIINDYLYGADKLNQEFDGIYLHSYCTVIEDAEVIKKLFENKEVNNENGEMKIIDGKLFIYGNISWKTYPIIPEKGLLQSEITKLLNYNPQLKKTKHITME